MSADPSVVVLVVPTVFRWAVCWVAPWAVCWAAPWAACLVASSAGLSVRVVVQLQAPQVPATPKPTQMPLPSLGSVGFFSEENALRRLQIDKSFTDQAPYQSLLQLLASQTIFVYYRGCNEAFCLRERASTTLSLIHI